MRFEGKTHYLFPTNCFIVDGAERSLIYDLHRNNYDIIPLELSAALKQCGSGNFEELFSHLPEEDLDFYQPFIVNLIEMDYLIPIDEKEIEFFDPMSTEWHYPYHLSTAIIEYSSDSPFSLKDVLARIDKVNCPAVEIRFTEAYDLEFYKELCGIFNGMCFRHMDLLIQYKEGQEADFMVALKNIHPILFSITQYQAPKDEVVNNSESQYIGLKRTTRSYDEIVNNHSVLSRNFYINREFYTESLHHNSFFNGKIAILKNGMIKNGTNSFRSFGNILETDLSNIHNNEIFTELWGLSKDKIEICRDCEYRYMCMDSRIPILNSENKWVYEEKCNYDPYTCKWNTEH
ncbi:grasp-with-spasm system SPASM domain peptide maturase [Chitinophaga polysaccharea]|uniref:grasp-with-spasm system SPASM domain peptide maturase n=1 Tax=Chitinophaga polysaccharea TaxID=1293035 RepID=UPI001156F6F9|nr:grasp-with-spasm system SPASM domain peptide maturase [Chitinophaga polysaccharea]